MKRNHRNTLRKITVLAFGAALASVAVLWSWNTLAPLFGGPAIEIRHAVALLIALCAARIVFGRGVGHRKNETETEVCL